MIISGPNEHKDFEDYKRCKGLLFKQCELGIANVDDPYFEDVFRGSTCRIETFGFSEKGGSARGECAAGVQDRDIWAWPILWPD